MTHHFHIMGIAGAGMSAIAHLLLDQGHRVSGCDNQHNMLSDELAARGSPITLGHDPRHLADVDTLVISSAVGSAHPEVNAARARGIPVLKRGDLWHAWSTAKPTLAVAGTHGKTTTTAMATLILEGAGLQPAYIVPAGGPVPGLERFARWGTGPFVVEADEYDRLLLGLVPDVAIVTSVDWDHVDIYPTRADVEATFATFAGQTRRTVIYCADDIGARRIAAVRQPDGALWQSYGFAPGCDWHIDQVEGGQTETRFTLRTPPSTGGRLLSGHLVVPGRHNVQNAVGAIAAAAHFGIDPEQALAIVATFQGAARRFEWKGDVNGITFVDDYAHNPAKIAATIAAARMRYGQRRLVIYFQPHTFSRTEALLLPLADALAGADLILVGDIYASREQATDFPGIDAALLVQHVAGHVEAVGDLERATARLCQIAQPGDVVLTLGAGDGYRVGDEARRRLANGSQT